MRACGERIEQPGSPLGPAKELGVVEADVGKETGSKAVFNGAHAFYQELPALPDVLGPVEGAQNLDRRVGGAVDHHGRAEMKTRPLSPGEQPRWRNKAGQRGPLYALASAGSVAASFP